MKLLVRTDGDHAIGSGHVMRMLALAAHARAAGHDVRFACARLAPELEKRIAAAGCEIERADVEPGSDDDAAWTAGLPGDWVLVDGYAFTDGFQAALLAAERAQLIVDDYGHCDRYVANVVLNTNAYADVSTYENRAENTELLLGPKYALLRPEFVRIDVPPTPRPRVLVTMGGADPVDATSWVVDALSRTTSDLEADVVIGPANPNGDAIRAAVTDPKIHVYDAMTEMAPTMRTATVAIAGAGITTYELAFLGVPSMLVALADNQVAVAKALAEADAAIDLGWHRTIGADELAKQIDELIADPDRRNAMSMKAQRLVDGRGAQRVLDTLARL